MNPLLYFLYIKLDVEPGYPPPEPDDHMQDFVDTLDMQLLATRAFRAVPSLKISKFVSCGMIFQRSYWMYERNDLEIIEGLPEGLIYPDGLLYRMTETMVQGTTRFPVQKNSSPD